NHPFIFKYYGNFLIEEKITVLVFEFIPGGTLLDLLLDKFYYGLNEDQAKFYISELIIALDHLHSKLIAFRDLKCDNVMIDEDGHIKLIDFGL
ncbi:kinase-like domain-containing protein, partial [Melampsora americana]